MFTKRSLTGLLVMGWVCMTILPASAEDKPLTAEMKLATGRSIAGILTPLRVREGGLEVETDSEQGQVQLAGALRQLSIAYKRPNYFLALDTDGDGKIDSREAQRVDRRKRNALLKIVIGKGESQQIVPIVFEDIIPHYRSKALAGVGAKVYPAWGMVGRLGRTKVVLIDANLDGRYSQDGEDAIAIDQSYALPLMKQHDIDGQIMTLTVADDGSTVTAEPVGGIARFPTTIAKQPRLWASLVLVDRQGGRAFDVTESGKAGLPAGDYEVACGVLARGLHKALMSNPPEGLFTIKADHENRLNIGADFKLEFPMAYHDGKVQVGINIKAAGCQGETYRFDPEAKSTPVIYFLVNKKIIKNQKMARG